jgi:hypothetical protein
MMVNEKLVKLIIRVHEKTERGEIPWERTAKEGTFLATFPEYSLLIYYGDSWAGRGWLVELHDSQGELLETVMDHQVAEATGRDGIIGDIWNQARRIALHVDEALDKMLDYLGA